MLPLRHRLKKDRDFERVLSSGEKKLFGPLLTFRAEAETEAARIGIVVSKKVSKKAVERNQVRRRLSHLLRPVADQLAVKDNVIIVLRLSDFDEYQKAIEKFVAWQKK